MKYLSRILIAALLVASMIFSCACGSSDDSDKKDRKSRAEREAREDEDEDDDEDDDKSSKKRRRKDDDSEEEGSGGGKLQGFLSGRGAEGGSGDASDADIPDELKNNMSGSHKDAGFYKIHTLTEGDDTMDRLQILEHGIEMYTYLAEDGSGYMYVMDHLYDIGWHDNSVMINDPESGPTELKYTRGNEYLVFMYDTLAMVFIETDEEPLTKEELMSGAKPSEGKSDDVKDIIAKYEGDWWGDFYCDDQTGWFKENLKKDTAYPVIARFAFDEDGNVTPFMTTAIFREPEKYNFNHMEAHLDKDDGFMYMNGGLMSGTMTEDTKITVKDNGFMSIETVLTNDKGDTVSVKMGLRRFKDEWQDDDDPIPEEKRRDFYKDSDFESMIEGSDAYSRDYPEATHVGGR